MRKGNPLQSYPPALRRKTKLPKSLRRPEFLSVIGLTDKKIADFDAEYIAYADRAKAHLESVLEEKMKMLKTHYGVSTDADLLTQLLIEFIPCFQIDESKPGQKGKWGEPLLIKLAVEVLRLRRRLPNAVTDTVILRELSNDGFFKGTNIDVLQNQYIRAKKLPLEILTKSINAASEEVRQGFIKEIEAAAKAAMGR